MQYIDDFKSAVLKSQYLGIYNSSVSLRRSRYLNNQIAKGDFNHLLQSSFGNFVAKDVQGQCVPMHYHLKHAIERKFGCKAFITIGSVKDKRFNKWLYDYTEEKISSDLTMGISQALQFHCWITLDSLEIIDVTLMTTIASVINDDQASGYIIARHASDLERFEYVPMIIGEKYLRTIGIDPATGTGKKLSTNFRAPSKIYKATWGKVINKLNRINL